MFNLKKTGIALVLSISFFFMVSCSDSDSYDSDFSSDKMVSVYVHFKTKIEKKEKDYFYFGTMSENTFKRISKDKEAGGFVYLSNVSYLDKDNIVRRFSNNLYSGSMLIKAVDISRINVLHRLPKYDETYKPEEKKKDNKDG
ncbi:MAG: hypothetical protein D6B27_09515 [Gammaproteobacteria bacterium]|nr:MAG: hypothetical protein D6B27_09515 [Gammaproteobacteria bacterium]